LANENLKIAAERFRLAQSTAIEMRQAETSYSNAMNRLVQSKFALKSAETELLRMMGKLVN
jgi:outer membrane protein TolC